MVYTGIREIDVVLLELYNEQMTLTKRLQNKPKSRTLIERHRKIVDLADRLLQIGLMFQETSSVDHEKA